MRTLSMVMGLGLVLAACSGSGKRCTQNSDCPNMEVCTDNLCSEPPTPVYDLSYNPFVDLSSAGSPTMPTCMSGQPVCPPGTSFQSSATQSGCFPSGTVPPGANNPPVDNPAGPCTGLVVVACDRPATCSFCLAAGSAIPPGCYSM